MREGKLDFDFGRSWKVRKYDEDGGFYKTKLAANVEPTKAVDFLCIPQGTQPLLLMEAKDFSLGVPHRETPYDAGTGRHNEAIETAFVLADT